MSLSLSHFTCHMKQANSGIILSGIPSSQSSTHNSHWLAFIYLRVGQHCIALVPSCGGIVLIISRSVTDTSRDIAEISGISPNCVSLRNSICAFDGKLSFHLWEMKQLVLRLTTIKQPLTRSRYIPDKTVYGAWEVNQSNGGICVAGSGQLTKCLPKICHCWQRLCSLLLVIWYKQYTGGSPPRSTQFRGIF